KNSISSSNLIQAIYDLLISIPKFDKNLESDTGFSFKYCVNFADLLDFQESSNLSESSIQISYLIFLTMLLKQIINTLL
ncbi:36496_t:CDS:2, partial [Gigaspora margarita]